MARGGADTGDHARHLEPRRQRADSREIEIEEQIDDQAKACHAALTKLARELGRPTYQILNIVDNVFVHRQFPGDETELRLLQRGLDRLASVLGVAVEGRQDTAAQEAPDYRRKAASLRGNAAKTSSKQERRKLVEDILRCRPASESPISADEVRDVRVGLLAHGFDVSPVTVWRDIGAVRRTRR